MTSRLRRKSTSATAMPVQRDTHRLLGDLFLKHLAKAPAMKHYTAALENARIDPYRDQCREKLKLVEAPRTKLALQNRLFYQLISQLPLIAICYRVEGDDPAQAIRV